MSKLTRRILITLVLLVLILIAPYWIYAPLLLVGLSILPLYWEGVFLAFVIDIIYKTGSYTWFGFPFPLALGACLVVLLSLPLRRRIRFNV